ncbi:MAG: hypothetical protein VW644_11050 [Alphaproteobacteria bacterium]|jgi:hypothetical protein
MKVLQLLVISLAYIVIVVHGAGYVAAPLWLVAIAIIGPFCWWLYAPLFRRRPTDLREDDRGCPPSLLDLLLEQTPEFRMRAAEKAAEFATRKRDGGGRGQAR